MDDNTSITKGNVNAVAYTDADNYAEAEAAAGGIVAGSGSVALVDNKDKVYAKTGKNVNVSAKGFTLGTEGKTAARTKNIGVNIGGLTIGTFEM